jgi:hypothetical protein
MRTSEFIKNVCVNTCCPYFHYDYGCRAYYDEECDEALYSQYWRGKTMRERIDMFCEKRLKIKNINKNKKL